MIWLVAFLSCIGLIVAKSSPTYNGDNGTVVGGQNAEPNKWKWQISVMMGSYDWNLFSPVCGGGLIDAFHIMWSASCIISSNLHDYKVVAVWGNTAHILQVAPVSVVEHPISSQPEWWGSMAQKNMVCAGGDVVVAGCQGDSGGPLSCFTDRAWRVYSVVSYGPAGMCNQYKKPTSLHQSVFLLRPELLSYQILKKHVVHTVTWSHLNKMKLHHSFCVFLHCMLSL
ncbi:chymotrypsin-like elastase family member 2A [Takifugu rubripes]|uniref:chymotrypsin-like elastase family member 2A n=1 Tax=Takifugu rubripes TaxID=31033 RepID=UPI0011453AD6|nr:chymotrypsin-like elastase family member 2A [Takifugu rubripes]